MAFPINPQLKGAVTKPAINTIPERLTAFRVYSGDDSTDYKGISDIQIPSLEPMKDTVKGAGIAGEYESPTLGQFSSMKLTMNWRAITKEQLLITAQKSQKFDCRGVNQVYDAAAGTYSTQSIKIVVQGPPTKVDPGKFDTSSTSGGSTEIEVLYLKIDIDGVNVLEIDKLNYKCVIDGVDYLASTKTALGLT
ncbi:phage tail protein [Paenibacillus psychroresistens]|uniref:Phage tail protein n=1 Tax=Paenibacillus psychroresistens TaxID=1778678 RepID=A0A6B8RKI8_9BACL|nr:phage major tail tube protein [Paenibacillus psychroresistens]QGQ95868.1 phage tail protein [Paenibacillus psychroresistens]